MKTCRRHAFSKSKGKIKGARKLRSCDVSLEPRLVSWRVVDVGRHDVGIAGFVGASATDVVGYLAGYDAASFDVGDSIPPPLELDVRCVVDAAGYVDQVGAVQIDDRDDEMKGMDFVHVGLIWDCMDEDDDWCLVGED